MSNKKFTREEILSGIIETEVYLNKIQDVDVLMEQILTEARKVVQADAGSIYVRDGDRLALQSPVETDQHMRIGDQRGGVQRQLTCCFGGSVRLLRDTRLDPVRACFLAPGGGDPRRLGDFRAQRFLEKVDA